jgi:hypothetical protein
MKTSTAEKRRSARQHEEDDLQRVKEKQFALYLLFTSGYFW